MVNPIETFWAAILSREPERVRTTFSALPAEEKMAVINHLKRMTTEPGWHPEQVESASLTLEILSE